MGRLAGCRGGGGRLSLVVLVSEKPNLVSEKSGKSQGILFICGAGNPEILIVELFVRNKTQPKLKLVQINAYINCMNYDHN